MDREAFEQLVSEWLDQPERDDLRRRIAAAEAKSPELERLKDEWLRLDQLVRGASFGVDHVDWRRFRQGIDQGLAPGSSGFDETLRELTGTEQRVDWLRLRERISRAVDRAGQYPRVIRFPLRRVAVRLALISAAAAAVVLMVTLSLRSSKTGVGVAQVRVSAPTEAWRPDSEAHGYARVTVSPPENLEEANDEGQSLRSGTAQPQLAEVFLMVEPAHLAARMRGSLTPFGFN